MSGGYATALQRAGGLLWREPAAWLPALLIEPPLLLAWLAALAGVVVDAAGGRGSWWAPLALCLLGAVVATALEAVWLSLADGLLQGGSGGWRALPGSLWRRVATSVATWLLLATAQVALALAGLLAFLNLLVGDDPERLGRLVTSADPIGVIAAGWAARGWFSTLGAAVLVAVCGAAREVVRLGGPFWRAALLIEGGTPSEAWRRGAEFAVGRGWALTGRSLLRGLFSLLLLSLGLGLVANLSQLAGPVGRGPGAMATGLMVALAAGGVSLTRSWFRLADLVWYRLLGGAGANPALQTRGVRVDRPRRPPRPHSEAILTVASEPAGPAGVWRPQQLASEPRE